MVKKKDIDRLARSLELLDTACEAAIELAGLCVQDNFETALRFAEDLGAVAAAIDNSGVTALDAFEHAYTAEQLENVKDTLDSVQNALRSGEYTRAAELAEFQLLPFLRQLREAFYFWGSVYPDKALMEQYYREEFAEHYKNLYVDSSEPLPYRLTILVTGYNHLDTTKQCIEQLLKETDFNALNAELVLIDHGSTDGTYEYFKSLGIGKVIHFKRNVRMNMFATVLQVCRSKYFSFVSNDILVTRHWAEILIRCLDSDERIIAAAPETPNISNLQMLYIPSQDPMEFIAWADKNNCYDPSKWSDRARLMPPTCMYRTAAVSKIGFADPLLYSMEFWDDDFSFRARRAGYRQLVCGGLACYHFGSVTGKKAQKKENTLVYGRELFQQKNGIDPWGTGFCYDYTAVQLIRQSLPQRSNLNVLGIDCGMGDTPLQIRNELRHMERNCALYQVTTSEEYLPDQKPFSREALYVRHLDDAIESTFIGVRFDCVYFGLDIAEYANVDKIIDRISARIAPGGVLTLFCGNPFFAPYLYALLERKLPNDSKRFTVTSPMWIKSELETHFLHVHTVAVQEQINGMQQFLMRHYSQGEHTKQIGEELQVRTYYYLCIK